MPQIMAEHSLRFSDHDRGVSSRFSAHFCVVAACPGPLLEYGTALVVGLCVYRCPCVRACICMRVGGRANRGVSDPSRARLASPALGRRQVLALVLLQVRKGVLRGPLVTAYTSNHPSGRANVRSVQHEDTAIRIMGDPPR